MSLTEEEANKLWHEMFEQNKSKMGIIFATELYQPVNIRKVLDEAKKDAPTWLKSMLSNVHTAEEAKSFIAFITPKDTAELFVWFLKWFGAEE